MAQSYVNTHVDHINDASKHWPVNIPWDSNEWEGAGPTLKSSVVAISTDVMTDLRQHAKALEYNFNFAGADPSWSHATDGEIGSGAVVDSEDFNTAGTVIGTNGGLLDGLSKMGITGIAAKADNTEVTKLGLDTIAAGLETKSSYDNYSNVTNTGYNQYVNSGYIKYANHANYYNHNQGYYYKDGWHANYGYKNKHSNHGQTIHAQSYYENAAYGNQTYGNASTTYANSFNNPAIYQNTL